MYRVGRICWPDVVARAREIVAEYDGGVTLRQVHYRCVAAGLIPNTPPVYRRLSSRLAQARREGRFPDLVDSLRTVHVAPSWPNASAFLEEVPTWFHLDRMRTQPEAVWLAAEKDTLRAMFTDWLAPLGLPVLVVRGFGSQSYVDVVRARTARDPRPAVLLYVGDFDCSGADIERDWVARTGCWSVVHRIALTYEQVQADQLPPAEGKRDDPRWPAFAAQYGFALEEPVQWEVEALDPGQLRRLVLAAVDRHIDRAALQEVVAEEDRQRRNLENYLDGWRHRQS